MHFYPFHISDFNNDTRHLDLIERAIYRDLLDLYYDIEKPINSADFAKLSARLMCRTQKRKQILQSLLDEFFELKNGLYHQKRCDIEIKKYRDLQTQKSIAGKISALKTKMKLASEVENFELVKVIENQIDNLKKQQHVSNEAVTDVEHTFAERSTNQEPTNQEPILKRDKPFFQNIHTHNIVDEISTEKIIATWKPLLETVNKWLKKIGLNEVSQNDLDAQLLIFNAKNQQKIENGATDIDLLALLVNYFKCDYTKQNSKNSSHDGKPTSKQIALAAKKLVAHSEFAGKFCATGKTTVECESWVATQLNKPEMRKEWESYLKEVGMNL